MCLLPDFCAEIGNPGMSAMSNKFFRAFRRASRCTLPRSMKRFKKTEMMRNCWSLEHLHIKVSNRLRIKCSKFCTQEVNEEEPQWELSSLSSREWWSKVTQLKALKTLVSVLFSLIFSGSGVNKRPDLSDRYLFECLGLADGVYFGFFVIDITCRRNWRLIQISRWQSDSSQNILALICCKVCTVQLKDKTSENLTPRTVEKNC